MNQTRKPDDSLFRHRIPLTFYPLVMAAALGLFFHPSIDITQIGYVSRSALFAIFCFGLLLRLWGSAILSSDVVVDQSIHDECLITHGPFAHIRHPLYTGAGFMIIVIAFFLPVFIATPLLIYELWVGIRLAQFEEKLMTDQFGDRYLSYKKNTGRFLPRFFYSGHDRQTNSAVHRFRQAIESELVFILYAFFLGCALYLKNKNIFFGGMLFSTAVAGLYVKSRFKKAAL